MYSNVGTKACGSLFLCYCPDFIKRPPVCPVPDRAQPILCRVQGTNHQHIISVVPIFQLHGGGTKACLLACPILAHAGHCLCVRRASVTGRTAALCGVAALAQTAGSLAGLHLPTQKNPWPTRSVSTSPLSSQRKMYTRPTVMVGRLLSVCVSNTTEIVVMCAPPLLFMKTKHSHKAQQQPKNRTIKLAAVSLFWPALSFVLIRMFHLYSACWPVCWTIKAHKLPRNQTQDSVWKAHSFLPPEVRSGYCWVEKNNMDLVMRSKRYRKFKTQCVLYCVSSSGSCCKIYIFYINVSSSLAAVQIHFC